MKSHLEILKNLGLSEKASKIYLSLLELGEASVQQIARTSRLKRTSIYYVLEELIRVGALREVLRGKRTYYIAEAPTVFLRRMRERVGELEHIAAQLEETRNKGFRKPKIQFLYGPSGFKQIWDAIFDSPEKEFRIITSGENFLDFVHERYILDYIIERKKKLAIKSRQLIADSSYARAIVAKDARENRISKILPAGHKVFFTEIICGSFVACISPRHEQMLFMIENESLARTRRALFDALWERL